MTKMVNVHALASMKAVFSWHFIYPSHGTQESQTNAILKTNLILWWNRNCAEQFINHHYLSRMVFWKDNIFFEDKSIFSRASNIKYYVYWIKS